MKTIIPLKIIRTENQFLYFIAPVQKDISERIESLDYSCWNADRKGWMIPISEGTVAGLIDNLGSDVEIFAQTEFDAGDHDRHLIYLKWFEQYLWRKKYEEPIIKTNMAIMYNFLRFFKEKGVLEIKQEDLEDYICNQGKAKPNSSLSGKQIMRAVKLFYKSLKLNYTEMESFKKNSPDFSSPETLTKQELKTLFEGLTNLKHRTMLSICYACGLRPGELMRLELKDLDYEKRLIRIRETKRGQERYMSLGLKTIALLKSYCALYKPTKYLFFGRDRAQEFSYRNLQYIFRKATKQTEIGQSKNLNTLRYSFAVHLREAGLNIPYIQELLGNREGRRQGKKSDRYSNKKFVSPFEDL